MRALTVALACLLPGCIFAADLGDGGDQAPNISFQKDAGNDALRIVNADPDAYWSDTRIVLQGCSGTFDGEALTSGEAVSGQTRRMHAGDALRFERAGPCEVTLAHIPTNSLYDTWIFR